MAFGAWATTWATCTTDCTSRALLLTSVLRKKASTSARAAKTDTSATRRIGWSGPPTSFQEVILPVKISLSWLSVSDLTGFAGLTMNLMASVPIGATSKLASLIAPGLALFMFATVSLIGDANMATSTLPALRSLRPLTSLLGVMFKVRPVSFSIAALFGAMTGMATAGAPLIFSSAAASEFTLAARKRAPPTLRTLRAFVNIFIVLSQQLRHGGRVVGH